MILLAKMRHLEFGSLVGVHDSGNRSRYVQRTGRSQLRGLGIANTKHNDQLIRLEMFEHGKNLRVHLAMRFKGPLERHLKLT